MIDHLSDGLVGIAVGAFFALSASGVVLTYSSTGVFNIAHFAIALLAAYLGWQLSGVWGLPLVVVVPIVLLVCGPVLGLVLERLVFRPLQARNATSSEKLVASLGVSVLILAVIRIVWGPGVQGSNSQPVPRLFGVRGFEIVQGHFTGDGRYLGAFKLDSEQLGTLALVVAVSVLLWFLLRHTYLGTQIRAVVDRRDLAELAAIDSNRVSQVAWSLGCTLAALTGLIIARGTITPDRIVLYGIETFSVAVVARLVSLPVAMLFGLFGIGFTRTFLDSFAPFGTHGHWAEGYQAVMNSASAIVLIGALVLYRRLDEVGESGAPSRGLATGALGRRVRTDRLVPLWTINLVAAGIAPFLLDAGALRDAHRVLALAVIFISIVCITGFSGHITLGQSSIAGAGAFFAARAANAWHLPVIIAMLVGASAAMFIGVLVGFPALRRKGIFLGLTTLGLALLINAFVFNEELLQGGPGGLTVRRPHLFGIDLTGDIRFYFYEYAVLCIVLLIAGNLRSGRLGRVLAAMRDSETAAQSVGIGLRRAKLFVFAVSSAMAGIGGALLTQADQNWDPVTFFPLFGLFWFTAVVVCGVSSLGGATVAAIIYVMLPSLTGQDLQSAIGLFGLGALALGWFPGGAAAQLPRIAQRLRRRLAAEYRAASQPPPEPPRPHELTPFAKRVLGDAGLR